MSTDAERRRLIRQDKRRYSFTFTGLLELRAGFLPFEARSAHLRGEAHWEVRLAAVHVEAQREEARYTVLGTLQPLRQPQLQFLGLYRPQNRQKTQGLLLKLSRQDSFGTPVGVRLSFVYPSPMRGSARRKKNDSPPRDKKSPRKKEKNLLGQKK